MCKKKSEERLQKYHKSLQDMKQKIVELEDRIDYIILNQKYEMNEGEQNGERKSVLFDV